MMMMMMMMNNNTVVVLGFKNLIFLGDIFSIDHCGIILKQYQKSPW